MLLIINSIKTTDSLLQARISSINGDPSGRGSNFEDTATHLILADPVEKNQSEQNNRRITVSSSLAGRGTGTVVDLRCYLNWEYKKLDDKEKKELGYWRKTPAGDLAMKKSREDAVKKRKQPRSDAQGNNNDGNAIPLKVKRKFEKAVEKQAKKIVASAMETEVADDDAFTARIDAAIKKRGATSEISAAAVIKTAVVIKKLDSTKQEAEVSQKAAKLTSIMGWISLNKK